MSQDVAADPTGFLSLGLSPKLVDLLVERKIDAPTEIQRQLIPQVLAGRDCRAITRTGSGKTNAYLLPLLQMVRPGEGLQALILLPTREVAAQAQRNLERHSREFPLRVRVATSSRGRPVQPPRDRDGERLTGGTPNILLGTPGAIRGLARHEKLDLSTVRILVLDEADSLLEGSSPEAIQELINHASPDRQIIIFAAEFDETLTALADRNQRDPVLVEAQPQSTPMAEVDQRVLSVAPDRRYEAVMGLLKHEHCKAVCIFAAHDNDAEKLAHRLERAGIEARWLNGQRLDERRPPRRDDRRGRDRHEDRRDGGSRHHAPTVYLSIDPAPRRLSATMLTHAVHLDLPHNPDVYVERVERCARLNRRGFSLLLLTPRDAETLALVEARIGKTLTPYSPEWARGFGPNEPREEPRGRSGRHDGRGDGRRGRPPETAAAASAPAGAVRSAPVSHVSPAVQHETPCSQRLLQPLRRNAEIEAAGIRPLPRTLGSRFRPAKSSREGKPKFARGLPRRWR